MYDPTETRGFYEAAGYSEAKTALMETTYELEIREGSPGYVFATRNDGQKFEVNTQYGSVEPRLESKEERLALIGLCRNFRPAPLPVIARDRSRDLPNVDAQMRAAGFEIE